MNTPAVYYINISFTWVLVLINIAGYFIVARRFNEKWAFWPILAAAWACFAISHTLLLVGTAPDAWYIMPIRVLGYVLVISSLLILMFRKRA
jgi:hypothetical protein